jgi:transposase
MNGLSTGKLSQRVAAEVLQLSVRHVRRLLRRYESEGDAGLVHRSRSRPSANRLSFEVRRRVVGLLKGDYEGFGPTFAAEKLSDRNGIDVSRETVRKWMIEEGLWETRRKRVRHRQWRARKSCRGELVQMDTSVHAWLEDRAFGKQMLIAMIDDATSRLYARFFESDSTRTNMTLIRDYIRRYGRPVAIYADKASHFKTTRQASVDESLRELQPETQIERALRELDIEYIAANSPQAKGRVERSFGTMQDRLIKEMRLESISNIDEANHFLEKEFIPFWNRRFTEKPVSAHNAHRGKKGFDLSAVLSTQDTRTVRNDYTIQIECQSYQIERKSIHPGLRRSKVTVERRVDGTTRIRWKNNYLKFHIIKQTETTETTNKSTTKTRAATASGLRPPAMAAKPRRKNIPAPNHPWRR